MDVSDFLYVYNVKMSGVHKGLSVFVFNCAKVLSTMTAGSEIIHFVFSFMYHKNIESSSLLLNIY